MNRMPVQSTVRVVGIAFLLVGGLGFVPGVTTHLYGGLAFAGDGSEAELLGLFRVSVLHNIVHLLFGVAGLALASTVSGARTYLVGGGGLYLVLWVLGLVGGLDWLPVNAADHWLHLALGLGMIGAGVALTRSRRAASVA
ncbi:MAG TPA: DUF4383 domain-containing protein [Gaiellaceae bacterium]|nr:DUF4383 domain-containing protein [Gaiellaceae bacterium]